jgi:glycerol uptake facilitator-like aquaporin
MGGVLGVLIGSLAAGDVAGLVPKGSMIEAFSMELWGTFLLAWFIVAIKDSRTVSTKDGAVNGALVSAILYGLILMGGPISGAAYNQVVGVVLTVFGNRNQADQYKYMWLYLISTSLGGVLAGIVQRVHG